jgi:F-type H+-transporting ATPase subunit b
MHAVLQTLATESNPGLLQALGIDVKLLVEQGLAFLILVFILGKFVYPALTKAIDDRRAAIEAGLQEAKESQEALQKAEADVSKLIEEARKEADDILARTHQESASMIADAESKAKTRAEQIVADARQQLNVDVTKAREALKKDTVELVALATERIIGEKLDDRKDADLVKKALAEEKA